MVRELASVVDRVVVDVAAGASWHQSAGELLRSRSIPRGGGVETVRGYQPYNAVVLHTQLVERGLAGGSGEFVTAHQCAKLGGEVLGAAARPEDGFVLESGDRRGIAVGIAGSPGVVLRPGVYRVLHTETQTTLDPSGGGRLRGGARVRGGRAGRGVAGAGRRRRPPRAGRPRGVRAGRRRPRRLPSRPGRVSVAGGLGLLRRGRPRPRRCPTTSKPTVPCAWRGSMPPPSRSTTGAPGARSRGSPSRRGRPMRRRRRRRRSRRCTRVRADCWRGARTCRSSGSVRPAGLSSIPGGARTGRRRPGCSRSTACGGGRPSGRRRW